MSFKRLDIPLIYYLSRMYLMPIAWVLLIGFELGYSDITGLLSELYVVCNNLCNIYWIFSSLFGIFLGVKSLSLRSSFK